MPGKANGELLTPRALAFYREVVTCLNDSRTPYLVGGAYALAPYTGIERHTKDFDVFVRERDYDRVMALLESLGCSTELSFPHWLGKAFRDGEFIDVIYSSGNAIASVDDEWFAHADAGEVFGLPVRLCPVEEIIWSKAFIMERERFDGADVAHLLHATAESLDWRRLLRRFDSHWQVLLTHLVLFNYIYPTERQRIPSWLMQRLTAMLQMGAPPTTQPICRGTYLSRAQYLPDITDWGYQDARVYPEGPMSAEEADIWTTAAIEDENVTISMASDIIVSESPVL
jgi:hypothetical protein